MRNRIAVCMVVLSHASFAVAAPRTIELAKGQTLSMDVPEELTVSNTPGTEEMPATVALKDGEGACEIRLKFATPKHIPTKEELKQTLQRSAQRLLADAVEDTIDVRELPQSIFVVMYFEVTDKREDAADGRYMLQGLGVSGKYLCQFMMLTKEKDPPARKAVLKALASMRVSEEK
ncbi:MAG: hypothetical protein ACK5SI_08955 [Planctomycetia bacterium]